MNARLNRTARLWWSRWLITSLLFLQLASAAYACSIPSAAAGEASMAGMPCAQAMANGGLPAMDPEQPGLCLEHCKGGSQTIEQGASASVASPAQLALFFLAVATEEPDKTRVWLAQERRRDVVPPPSHAILHCCFRI